ncbi:helix-turn-helix domain-containing protein [Laceyella sacchari]|jgi:tetratricopeptide (TPR) repeat protein|uniref:Helix-turn-helix domain-containing protein n=1 Tax=Laceyella sacchari TaxID=37482 RepID=A0ABY5U212_LACSH|nr:helix-turn-helix transcriptional regulator [Laceyella sacchari]UWE03682.1 helix-turn-helix domain-containing protein [Laceyella sacchari]
MDFEKIGRMIRKERLERGLRLEDLADEHVSASTLSAMERGKNTSHPKFRYVLDKLGLTIESLNKKESESTEREDLQLSIIESLVYMNPKKAITELKKRDWAPSKAPIIKYLNARARMRLGEDAESEFHETLKALEKSIGYNNSNLRSCCFGYLSVLEYRRKHYYRALELVEKGIECFNVDGERKNFYLVLSLNRSIYYKQLGQIEKSLNALEKIDSHTSFDLNIDSVLGIYDLKARLKLEIKLYQEAIQIAKSGIEIARINYNYDRQLELWITLGSIYKAKWRSEKRKHYLEMAGRCFSAGILLEGKVKRRKKLIFDAYKELAIIYRKTKEFEKTHQILSELIKITKNDENMVQYSRVMVEVGKVCLDENDLESAIQSFQDALNTCDSEDLEYQAVFGLVRAYSHLGKSHESQVLTHTKRLVRLLERRVDDDGTD